MSERDKLIIELLRMILRMVAAHYFAGAGNKPAQVYFSEYMELNERCHDALHRSEG